VRSKLAFLFLPRGLSLILLVCLTGQPVSAAPAAKVTRNQATLNFPDSITFQASFENETPIDSIVLEYGTDELTCGTVIAKAFPDFTQGNMVQSTWTWEMKQSGSLPPGAIVWWRWRTMDTNQNVYVSEEKSLTWLDDEHPWQMVSSGLLNLHWYTGDQAFAQNLLDAAQAGLDRLQKDAGLQPDKPINLYIYGNTNDLQEAILYEPSWTGGLAFAVHDIVLIGIAPSDIEWGRTAIAHELTHVLVGHLTFSCLGDVPTWLNEGLAVYSEGTLDPASANQLSEAIRSDQLLSVRSLSGGFSEIPGRAYLSYSQSYSLVKFLIENYGQSDMTALLLALRDGNTIDEALQDVYGFDVPGLESAWRDAVGATPQALSSQPTAQPTPTFVPTYVPFAGVPLNFTVTPYALPPSPGTERTTPTEGPPLSLTLTLAALCCVLFLLFGVIGLSVFLAAQKEKGSREDLHTK